jgi:hypothetical protein
MAQAARAVVLTAAMALGLLTVAAATQTASARAAAGPEILKCAKFKQGIGGLSGAQKAAKLRKFNDCLAQNKANRVAFNQIKDSRFVGTRGDGEEIEDFYCASGKYESRSSGSYGTGVSTGSSWSIADATVRQGGKWIEAVLRDPDGYEIGLLRRGAQWQIAVASLGRMLYPGDVVKTDAGVDCA